MPPFSSGEKETLKQLRKLLPQIQKEPSRKALKQGYLSLVRELSSHSKKIQWYLYLAQIYYKSYPKEALKLAIQIKKLDPNHKLASQIIKYVNSMSHEESMAGVAFNPTTSLRNSRGYPLTEPENLEDTVEGDPDPQVLMEASGKRNQENPELTLPPDMTVKNLSRHLGKVHNTSMVNLGSPSTLLRRRSSRDDGEYIPSGSGAQMEPRPSSAPQMISSHRPPTQNSTTRSLREVSNTLPPEPPDLSQSESELAATFIEPPLPQEEISFSHSLPPSSPTSPPPPGTGEFSSAPGESQILEALSLADEETLGKLLVKTAATYSHTPWWQQAMARLMERSKKSQSQENDDYCLKTLMEQGQYHLVLDILATLATLEEATPPKHLRLTLLEYYYTANRELGRAPPTLNSKQQKRLIEEDYLSDWRRLLQTTAPRGYYNPSAGHSNVG